MTQPVWSRYFDVRDSGTLIRNVVYGGLEERPSIRFQLNTELETFQMYAPVTGLAYYMTQKHYVSAYEWIVERSSSNRCDGTSISFFAMLAPLSKDEILALPLVVDVESLRKEFLCAIALADDS